MTNARDKHSALKELARKRKAARLRNYGNIDDYAAGAYDSEHVSPYTRGAGNVDSEILLVLQDWWSEENLRGPLNEAVARLGRDDALPTNRNLERLLLQTFGCRLDDVYATNLFPFVKRGGMSASIPVRDLSACAVQYTLPEIEIVRPRLVVCFGAAVYRTLHRVLTGASYRGSFAGAIAAPLDVLFAGRSTRFWAQAHPGNLGTNNRGREQVTRDWQLMAQYVGSERLLSPECSSSSGA